MANGDPMILSTLTDGGGSMLLNGDMEDWADTADAADYWTWTETQVATLSRQSGTRTGGAGSYFQRISIAAPAQSEIGIYSQEVTPEGSVELDVKGHDGQTLTCSVWARDTGAGTSTLQMKLIEYDAAETSSLMTPGDVEDLTSDWVQYTFAFTLSYDLMHHLNFQIFVASSGAGSSIVDLDDALLYIGYTFAANPSMPDNQILSVPMRQFRRTLGGRLIRSRPAGPVAKIEKQLSFRLVGQAQHNALRSLWLLDQPMTWTPNHPHLPSTLQVRWVNDFDFHTIGPFSSGPLYAGTMVLSEI